VHDTAGPLAYKRAVPTSKPKPAREPAETSRPAACWLYASCCSLAAAPFPSPPLEERGRERRPSFSVSTSDMLVRQRTGKPPRTAASRVDLLPMNLRTRVGDVECGGKRSATPLCLHRQPGQAKPKRRRRCALPAHSITAPIRQGSRAQSVSSGRGLLSPALSSKGGEGEPLARCSHPPDACKMQPAAPPALA
jgi:hypothetical protein